MDRFQHGGNVHESPPRGGWLDFSANINPLGLAPEIHRVIQKAIESIVHYPDPEAKELRKAIGEYYCVPERNILLGNGASELFYLFFHTLHPRRALIPVPSFSEYERAALAVGCEVLYVQLREAEGFALDVEGIGRQIKRGDAVLLGNPNNPTGCLISPQEILYLADLVEERGAWLLLDESFLQFCADEKRRDSHHLSMSHSQVITLESLTKFFAIPGLRLGFASMAWGLRKRMETGKDVWNVNHLAQLAGKVAFKLSGYRRESRRLVAEEDAFLLEELQQLPGLKPFSPSVNFILLDVRGTGRSSTDLVKAMREKGILLRDCANYPGLDGKSYVRMAVRTRGENKKVLEAWREILL